MKKQVLLLLAVLLAVGMIGIGAQTARAETTYTEGTLYYIVQNDSVTITGCFSRNAEVRVPAMIAGYPVNTIATGAFASNTNVKTVYLPDTITHIQSGAFGDWIHIVYNANTDHPQDVPSDLILENWDTDPSAQPSATATQAGQTQQPDTTPQQGTGSLDGDTTPKPTQTAGTATEKATSTATATPETTPDVWISEGDVNLGEDDDTPEPVANTPEPVTAPTEEPKVPMDPVAEVTDTEAPEAAPTEPGKVVEPEPDKPKSYVWLWVLLGAAAAGGAAAIVLVCLRKKNG